MLSRAIDFCSLALSCPPGTGSLLATGGGGELMPPAKAGIWHLSLSPSCTRQQGQLSWGCPLQRPVYSLLVPGCGGG